MRYGCMEKILKMFLSLFEAFVISTVYFFISLGVLTIVLPMCVLGRESQAISIVRRMDNFMKNFAKKIRK